MEQNDFNNICREYEFSEEVQFIKETIAELELLFKENSNFEVSEKSERDLLTTMDLAVEEKIISGINSKFPNDIILSEETASDTRISDRCWVIDPIDGTCNYATGSPLYAVQIAFTNNKTAYVACIYFPELDECFFALKGEGAFLNGNRIKAREETDISKMIVSLGDYNTVDEENSKMQHDAMDDLRQSVMRIRMFGASCADFCYLAVGRTSAVVSYHFHAWDIVPGILIAEEAGAICSGVYGDELDIEGHDGLVISNSKKFNEYIINLTKSIKK
ncbi:MAG: inositol monophosphatase [Oscillospiraceae bacterium]|nr:inositol monophosphatase [Oscillospiraceae bacterium]